MTAVVDRGVGYKDLRGFLSILEEASALRHVRAQVDLRHEIGAISARTLRHKGPALVFENIEGYPGQCLVTNILDDVEKFALALGTEPSVEAIIERIEHGKGRPIPPRVIDSAACQEVVRTGDDVDLDQFPTPWWHELDGGRYIGTTGGVITADPRTGYINVGLYRAMIKDRNTLSVSARGDWEVGAKPPGYSYGAYTHVLLNEAQGKPTPVAIALGMDPLLTYAGGRVLPSESLQHAEYAIAGGWRGAPTELAPCKTSDLLVPAWAEIIIEGEFLPNERSAEGPHGESQGFYNSHSQVFMMHVRCITHRKSPVSYGLICGAREDFPKFMQSSYARSLLATVDNITDVHVPEEIGAGAGMFLFVAARVETTEEVEQLITAIGGARWGGNLRPRWFIIVDDDCDLHDLEEVMWRVGISALPDHDVQITERTFPLMHEPMTRLYDEKGSRIFIDATFKTKQAVKNGKTVGFTLPVNKISRELAGKVESRWREYGID
ncbi:MAG: 3-octaprenyl-4-hydroxybenzoate carboxy-lyase [Chloroflexi bacterium]|nr:3-octaprenyl-4-hydroxybenzoate carboxy-lyase [Chloroflexota bacterium]